MESRTTLPVGEYVKKPVKVEAILYDGSSNSANNVLAWLILNGGEGRIEDGYTSQGPDALIIKTLEGEMRAKSGDFIIRGVRGEFYPCDGDIFMETYENAPRIDPI